MEEAVEEGREASENGLQGYKIADYMILFQCVSEVSLITHYSVNKCMAFSICK